MGCAIQKDFAGNHRVLRVAVVLGGHSAEREVSRQSGNAVANGLTEAGHRVACIDPAEIELSTVDWPKFDVAFIALHGQFGEDGQIQTLLDSWGVPYTGSGAEASRLAFSKSAAKERFLASGVPTPPYVLVHEKESARQILEQANRVGFPLVMKPDSSGSSLGVSVVRSPSEVPGAAGACFAEGSFGLLERAISGTEWTLGLVDEDPLPLVQIRTSREFYDFEAKYDDEETTYCDESAVSREVSERIRTAALAAAVAIGTQGVARVDVRLDASGQPWVLEVNTVPGFTGHSLVPKAAAMAGLSFAELCHLAVQRALATYRIRRHDTNKRRSLQHLEPLRFAS